MADKSKVSVILLTLCLSLTSLSKGYDVEAEQRQRLQHFHRVCQKYRSDPLSYEYSALYRSQPEFFTHVQLSSGKLGMCLPDTDITTSMFVYFKGQWAAEFDNKSEEEILELRQRADELTKDYSRFSHKSILVEHPLIRLLAAYRRQFIQSSLSTTLTAKIQLWLSTRKDKLVSKNGQVAHNVVGEPTITFRQFINFLIKCPQEVAECKLWVHETFGYAWKPIWLACHPCIHGLDSILDVQHWQKDKDFLDHKLNLNTTIDFPPVKYPEDQDPMDIVHKAFADIPKSEIYEAYIKYKLDHELFNYDPKPIIDMGLDDLCSTI